MRGFMTIAPKVLSRVVDPSYRHEHIHLSNERNPMSESSVNFRSALHGYDREQVDQHMNQLAQAAAAAWHEAAEHTRQINELTAANSLLKAQAESHAERARVLEEEQREAAEPSYTGLGERIGSVLTLIDNEAFELRTRAQADAANTGALADENAYATRQAADDYARQTRGSADDEITRLLEEARVQAESLLDDTRAQAESLMEGARAQADSLLENADRQSRARQDADRQATARREEAEAAYERARAKSAAAAMDFETTLAARREASALEFAAQVTAAEEQLTAVRMRAEQVRSDAERTQQEAASKIALQLEQAMSRAQSLVAEAKIKAERIRENSERELAVSTERRDSINAQLSSFRHELAELGAARRVKPLAPAEPAADQNGDGPEGEQEVLVEPPASAEFAGSGNGVSADD
jgi:cell division septum initiation protein DivIVA